jgi:hypothetical protein
MVEKCSTRWCVRLGGGLRYNELIKGHHCAFVSTRRSEGLIEIRLSGSRSSVSILVLSFKETPETVISWHRM